MKGKENKDEYREETEKMVLKKRQKKSNSKKIAVLIRAESGSMSREEEATKKIEICAESRRKVWIYRKNEGGEWGYGAGE